MPLNIVQHLPNKNSFRKVPICLRCYNLWYEKWPENHHYINVEKALTVNMFITVNHQYRLQL